MPAYRSSPPRRLLQEVVRLDFDDCVGERKKARKQVCMQVVERAIGNEARRSESIHISPLSCQHKHLKCEWLWSFRIPSVVLHCTSRPTCGVVQDRTGKEKKRKAGKIGQYYCITTRYSVSIDYLIHNGMHILIATLRMYPSILRTSRAEY